MPVKKPARAKKSPRLKKKTSQRDRLVRLAREHATVAIPLAAICVLAVAMILAAQQPSPSAETLVSSAQTERSAEALAKAATPVDSSAAASEEAAHVVAASDAAPSAHVTLTGCLERADEAFRLKETSGSDAPKARNWRWGFLKKGPAAVQVVDGSNHLRLGDHVGQRITVTGTLVDREMQVRSLQRVSTTCGPEKAKV
jgi:hypothetical protein